MLFNAKKGSPIPNQVSTTVKFKLDKKKGRLVPHSAKEKMVCALRKVLAAMSDQDENGCRFYIDGKTLHVTRPPTASEARPGEPRSYKAAGRCRVGVCHPAGHKSSKVIEFSISFRDTKDDRGLDDIEFFDPTTIDELPRNTPLSVPAS
jgi:hypothetical protein